MLHVKNVKIDLRLHLMLTVEIYKVQERLCAQTVEIWFPLCFDRATLFFLEDILNNTKIYWKGICNIYFL